jgi:hypothetical protein
MRPTWSAVATRTRLILLLLAVGLRLGYAGAAYSQDTQCPDASIRQLQYGKCMPYTYGGTTYVLCNGPYSLCTIADCSSIDATSATCQCKVVESGLSMLLPPQSGPPITTTSPEISNFSYAQFPLTSYKCPPGTAQVVNCLNAPCTVSPTDSTKSSCTCTVTDDKSPPGQLIFFPPGTTQPPCSTLRSGAPVNPATQQLDFALTAAMNCVMLHPNPGR